MYMYTLHTHIHITKVVSEQMLLLEGEQRKKPKKKVSVLEALL